jgi:hypothetical protein
VQRGDVVTLPELGDATVVADVHSGKVLTAHRCEERCGALR